MIKSADTLQSVLVHVGLDRLGDGLLKLPFVRGLRRAFPHARLTWFAGKETTVYAGALNALVADQLDEIIEYGGIGHSPKELFARRPLPDRSFDLVIDTQRNFSTALSAMRIRHRYFISPAAKFLLSSARPKSGYKFPRAMQRQMLDLLEIASGKTFPTPDRLDLDIPATFREQARVLLPDGTNYIAFAPGSGGRPKCWPLDRFMAVAASLQQTGTRPVFLIGPQELEWAEVIRQQLPEALMPLQAGQGAQSHNFNPLLSIALAERMSAAVSNDSGIAHMLAVGGAPLVALYGPTVYEKFPPMCPHIAVVRAATFGSREMSAIPTDAVIAALQGLLAKAPAS